ncbi:hypothetical protein [Croceicoccus gelatinilyticus]|uniref:hypothetical protein n=1 Tax=Croceicoccus gelatinilyticus TaxID=2835536 RepID=UPI001BCB94EB|nr:hypothetical protein [Croceicoccus gelatinilyticus]
MRRPGGHLYLVKLKSGVRPKRMKDKPDWDRRTISRWSRRAKLVVYLNRYEGIPVESLPAAIKHDGASDAIFARHVAGSEDSYIVLDPDIIESIHRFDRNERPSL